MPPTPPLLLASTSPYRKALLGRLGLPFAAAAPGVAETGLPDEAPKERALRLALAKAHAVAAQHPEALVIGSDQVASVDAGAGARLLHKPGDRATCISQLQAMAGRTACFDTAIALVYGSDTFTHVDRTLVRFRTLTLAEIERYVDREPAFDCAGGFKCEGLGVTLFESIETVDPTGLEGLPLIAVCAGLRRLGVVP